jgi:hypothetical protein
MQSTNLASVFALCLLFCAYTQPSNAQNQLNGNVTEVSHQGLLGANVLLLNSLDSSLVKGQLSGDKGSFRFENLDAGTYFLRVTMLGFAEYMSPKIILEAKASEKNLAAIELLENSSQLNEVQIVAKKPFFEQKIDRMVINVAGSSVNAGGNALQVLQRSPGVLVNKQSNVISMAGKFGVLVMINGKISRMLPDAILAMLEGMNADNIERIELIHTPPSSFDADGNAGIINIVLKQSQDEGLNGGYSLNVGYGRKEKYGAGLNFNYRRKKLNFFGSGDHKFDRTKQVFTNYRGIRRASDFLETDGFSDRSPYTTNTNGRLGVDLQISPKTLFGVVGTYFNRYWNMYALNDIDYLTNKTLASRVQMSTHEINHWSSATGNLNFSHQFTKDKTLSADVDYVWYKIQNPSDYNIKDLMSNGNLDRKSQLRIRKENPIKIAVAKADYNQNMGKDVQFEAGAKITSSLFDNDVRVDRTFNSEWQTDTSLTSRFKLTESVVAAYSSLSFKGDAKTDFKLGLRYEFTNTNLGSVERPNVVDRQYGAFFPSIFVGRKISEVQQLNLSYSRRIGRPGFTQLAPYLIFYDPTTVQSGNPALQPAFVNAIRTDYRYKTVSVIAEYNQESPSIRDLPFVNVAENSQVIRPENIGKTHTAFVAVIFPLQIAKWWEMQNQFFVAYQLFDMQYEGSKIKLPTQFVGMNSTQSFHLPQKWSLELSGGMITANNSGLIKYKTNGILNIGIQKELGERWGKLSLNVADIFLTNNYFGTANQPDLNLLVRTSYQESERTFMLTWTNKFGNKRLKSARERERGASEELRRL